MCNSYRSRWTFADVRKSPERACHLAKNAFDDAVLSVDTSNAKFDQNVRDSMAILQLLMDDMLLWSEELKGLFLTLNIPRVMIRILYRRRIMGFVVCHAGNLCDAPLYRDVSGVICVEGLGLSRAKVAATNIGNTNVASA